MQNNLIFNFRIEKATNGAEIINTHLQTPWDSLTPEMLIVYKEMENTLYIAERMKRKAERQQHKKYNRFQAIIAACFNL